MQNLYFSLDHEERLLAYKFLGEIGIEKQRYAVAVVKLLLKALVDKDVDNQVQGIHYLGELGASSSSLSSHLIYPFIQILLQPDLKPVIEFHVLHALDRLNKDSEDVKEFLYRGISDIAYMQTPKLFLQDPAERQAAAWRIGKLGKISFPAVVDLIPALLNRLVDDDEHVKTVTFKALLELMLQNKDGLVHVLLDNLELMENPFLKLQVFTLLGEFSKKDQGYVDLLVPILIKELESQNRIFQVKIQKILKVFERISPGIFVRKHKPLLVDMLKSPSRYAYHWAVKTFASSQISTLHELADKDVSQFIDENSLIVEMLIKNHRGNIMQTRVILMMLIHETNEMISKVADTNSPVATGLHESLAQIQKSGLSSETEVVAAYEKFKTILKNSKLFLSNNSSST